MHFSSYRASTLGVAAVLCAGAGTPAPQLDRAGIRDAVTCLLGAERAAHGRPALRGDPRLERAAQRHSRDMVDRSYFAHVSPGGGGLLDRLRRAGYAGNGSILAGEILARGTGTGSKPAALRDAWLASPPHRDLLLDGRFEALGVGVSPGSLGGRPGVTVTVDFGRRGPG